MSSLFAKDYLKNTLSVLPTNADEGGLTLGKISADGTSYIIGMDSTNRLLWKNDLVRRTKRTPGYVESVIKQDAPAIFLQYMADVYSIKEPNLQSLIQQAYGSVKDFLVDLGALEVNAKAAEVGRQATQQMHLLEEPSEPAPAPQPNKPSINTYEDIESYYLNKANNDADSTQPEEPAKVEQEPTGIEPEQIRQEIVEELVSQVVDYPQQQPDVKQPITPGARMAMLRDAVPASTEHEQVHRETTQQTVNPARPSFTTNQIQTQQEKVDEAVNAIMGTGNQKPNTAYLQELITSMGEMQKTALTMESMFLVNATPEMEEEYKKDWFIKNIQDIDDLIDILFKLNKSEIKEAFRKTMRSRWKDGYNRETSRILEILTGYLI